MADENCIFPFCDASRRKELHVFPVQIQTLTSVELHAKVRNNIKWLAIVHC